MKRLILSGLVALGLAWAQGFYVGGHAGFFGGSGVNFPNVGIHAGFGLQGGLEVRGGIDVTSFLGLFYILGVNADALINFGTPGSALLPYVGLGGNLWFLGGTTDFGVHATLGLKLPIAGAPLTPFLEVQPGYAFGGGGAFVYYIKVGANYGF